MKNKILAITAVSALLAGLTGCATMNEINGFFKAVDDPLPPIPVNYNWSYNQSWKTEQSKWFWHFPQGTAQIPYKWLVSLEQPIGSKWRSGSKEYNPIEYIKEQAKNSGFGTGNEVVSPEILSYEKAADEAEAKAVAEATQSGSKRSKSGLFIDDKYLAGFGFIPMQTEYASKENPDALPLGLTRFDNFVNPQQKNAKPQVVMGFGCALCHTSRIDYQGKSMLVDGGPSQANLPLFVEKLTVALAETYLFPTRLDRFANRVYGHQATTAEKEMLKTGLKNFVLAGAAQAKTVATTPGFGRLDALTAIGNTVFGAPDLNAPENALPANAPVSYPMIWTVPWFEWAEYPGAVEQPMVRNVGEALGVNAPVNLTSNDPSDLFKSTVQVGNLYRAETLLMEGEIPWEISKPTPDPYKYIDKNHALPGLSAPKWPVDMFGPIDQAKAQAGAKLYASLCQGCHLAPLDSPELYKKDAQGNLNLKYWTAKNKWGKQYLNVRNIGVEEIGTDNTEVMNFYARTAATGNLTVQGTPLEPASAATQNGVKKLGTYLSAADGLRIVTETVADKWYSENGIIKDLAHITPQEQATVDMLNGYRANVVNKEPPAYRARPLDGIWATPTYLHNGSVPNLYQLLSPLSERATQFVTGSKEFDPKYVGYVTCFDQACIDENKIKGYSVFSVKDGNGNPITGNSNAGHEFTGDGKTNMGNGVIGRGLSVEERWDLVEYLKTL